MLKEILILRSNTKQIKYLKSLDFKSFFFYLKFCGPSSDGLVIIAAACRAREPGLNISSIDVFFHLHGYRVVGKL